MWRLPFFCFHCPQHACGSNCWATWLRWSAFFHEVAPACILYSGTSKITGSLWWTTWPSRSLWMAVGSSRRTGGCSASLMLCVAWLPRQSSGPSDIRSSWWPGIFRGGRTFWRISSVVPNRFFPWNGPFFWGFLRRFARCLGIPILTSLSPAPIPSFLCKCPQFRTWWLGSRIHSSTRTICQPMPSLRLLCSGRFCREFFFRPGSRCGPRRSGSLTFGPCWSTNFSDFCRCGTCWYSSMCGSSIEA